MKLSILSDESEPFRDRQEAGFALGEELRKRIKEKPVILGIPRGGMVTAAAISSVLECDIDIILTHKIGAPENPELAIGAVSEDGKIFLNDYLVRGTEADPAYIEEERKSQLNELIRRRKLFRSVYPKVSLKNRIVVVVDDGIATGATAQAALWAARYEKPLKLIGAFPVAPPETLEKLNQDADEIICLRAPTIFQAISQFYYDFPQVADEEILKILRQEQQCRNTGKRKCATH